MLLLDAGNIFYIRDNETYRRRAEGAMHAMSVIGDYVLNLTASDLVFGEEFIRENANKYELDFVSANITKSDGDPFWKPYIIKEIQGEKVAITGITKYQETKESDGYSMEVPINPLTKLMPELNEKADIIVVMAYIDLAPAKRLAKDVPDIDVLVVGGQGSSLMVPTQEDGTETIMGKLGKKCKYLGRIDLFVEDKKIVKFEGKQIPLSSSIEDHEETRTIIDKY